MKSDKTAKIVLTALMMCLIILSTMLIKVPIPFTQGYVHLGDAMIFLSVLILGWKYGAVAAGLGSMLGDIIGGAAAWAPWTLVIKGGMALLMGVCLKGSSSKIKEIIGMIFAGAFMTLGYYAAEGVMYGNWVVSALGIPWNIGQFTVGMIIAEIMAAALSKTPAVRYLTYKNDSAASRI
ncbi:MAG: ECF transporter S component [Firmicutes bacterium]|nr:ECF transporter S component [Bacillota bacterium]